MALEKVVGAVLNMRGIKGYFRFQQASPFDLTQIDVNLTNLENKVGPYHVHLFPVSSLRPNPCSNDNVGGHWNPFELNTNDPSYPNGPGSTHDQYEVGDLSGKHMSLAGRTAYADTFTDFNLPLFGQNSIVGRSVVIHLLDGARYRWLMIKCGAVNTTKHTGGKKTIIKGINQNYTHKKEGKKQTMTE
uniref:Superoxide dismutase copper/zinc binding domain-containing protein n=1 Tax=Kryptolebias marmoratus TaxID=37003 RepID=A0A3Q3BBY2_KRYMA